MTVQYYQEVLSAGPIAFLKLLRKWKGGVFKLIYMDFIVFSALYTMISCIYRFILREEHKRQFEKVVTYVYKSQSLIPVAFILGFYVSLVFNRFWRHFNTVPWITKIAILISSHLNESTTAANSADENTARIDREEGRLQRRSIIRYLVASLILTLSRVSVPVKRRFPTIDDIHAKGILLEHEAEMIKVTEPFTMQPFLPITWSTAIVMKAGQQGRITNEAVLINTVKEINRFRQLLQELFLLDQVCVPLVYTQVVTLAVYSYFLSCLVGRQFVSDPNSGEKSEDFIVPIFTILQFIVYMGWLKLALTLVNPMGEDDEDFDLNCVVDYNFEVGLAVADGIKINQPSLIKDKFFNQKTFDLPMQNSMKDAKAKPFMGSVYDMKVDNESWITSLKSVVVGSELDSQSEKSQMQLNEETLFDHSGRNFSRNLKAGGSKKRTTSVNSASSIFTSSTSLKGLDVATLKIEEEIDEPDDNTPQKPHGTDKYPLLVIEEEEQSVGNDIDLKILRRASKDELQENGDSHDHQTDKSELLGETETENVGK